MINNYGNKMKRNSNSKLAQFKAAVAHLPFTEFDELSNSIAAVYEVSRTKTNPGIRIEVGYSQEYKGTSCNFEIFHNDVLTDSYGTYDIDEFVEQLEPYFNLGDEVSLLRQLDRRLTKLEMLVNDDSNLAMLLQQELDDDEVNYASSVPLEELLDLINEGDVKDIIITAIQTGELDKATLEDMLVMAYDREETEFKNRGRKNNSLPKGKLGIVNGATIGTNSKLGYGALGVSRVKELELDELSKVGYVKRKDGKLVKRKLMM